MRLHHVAPAVLLALLAGCGSSPTAPTLGGPTRTTSSSASPKPSVGSAIGTYKQLNKEALQGVLLQLSDMPPGFTSTPADTSQKHNFCGYNAPADPEVTVAADYQNAGDSEGLSFYIRQFASPGAARVAFHALVSTLRTCHGETYKGSSLTYSPMSAPRLGDDSVGVQIETSGQILKQNFALIGPVVISGGGLNVDASQIASLLTEQLDKYRAVARF